MSAILNPHDASLVGLLTIGGNDVTCAFENASFDIEPNDIDVSSACLAGARMQTVGMQGTLAGRFYGASSNGYVTNYLDFAGISVGGSLVQPQAYSMDFRGTFERADLPAYTMGLASGILRRNFSGTLELLFDDNEVAQALYIAAASMNPADKLTTLGFTLNGNAVGLPIKLGRATLPIQRGDYTKTTISFTGQAPNRGTAYPTTPTTMPGSPGLLDYALLSPRSVLPFEFKSKLTHGIDVSGYVTLGDFGFNYSQRAITYFDYQFLTYGNFTTVSTGAGS